MDSKVSRKITAINIIGIVLIVILHSLIEVPDSNPLYPLFCYIRVIGDSAVPTFFVVSAFLYFINKNSVKIKITKRIKSLLIPYMIWSILFFICYSIISHFIEINMSINYSFAGILNGILKCQCIPQFWYIRYLFYLILLSIPYEYLLKKGYRIITFIIPTIVMIANYYFGMNTTICIQAWIPLFFYVGWICYYYKGLLNILKNNSRLLSVIAFAVYLFIPVLISNYGLYTNVYYTWRLVSPFILIAALSIFDYKSSMFDRDNDTFMIFALHYFIISIVRKLLFIFIDNNVPGIIVVYIMSVLLGLLISIIISKIVKKIMPRIYSVITGNRGVGK